VTVAFWAVKNSQLKLWDDIVYYTIGSFMTAKGTMENRPGKVMVMINKELHG